MSDSKSFSDGYEAMMKPIVEEYERELANEEAAHLSTENAAQKEYDKLTAENKRLTVELERVRAAAQKAKNSNNVWDIDDLINTALGDKADGSE